MTKTYIIVAGSRSFRKFRFSEKILNIICSSYENVVIVSGGAEGGDHAGELYQRKHKDTIKLLKKDAKWKKYGKRAGHIRNGEMASIGNMLVAFWDMESPGTQDMIEQAIENNLEIYVFDFIHEKLVEYEQEEIL
jgi:hypothetical protein